MTEDDVLDPRVVPRWMEVGVSGVPRRREWDVVVTLELPELEGSPVEELTFQVLADGTAAGDAPPASLEAMRAELEGSVAPPYEGRAARRSRREWAVAAREVRAEALVLPAGIDANEITLAVAPDGARTVLVDGVEEAAAPPGLDAALAELERRGRERYGAFAARAERIGPGSWTLTVDPL